MIRLFDEKWVSYKDEILELYFRGWFEYDNVIYHEVNSSIFSLFRNVNIGDLIKDFNGSFSFIIIKDDILTIIADRNRSYPVLYFIRDNKVVITDSISKYGKTTNAIFTPQDVMAEQYFASSYIFDKYTLFENVFSVQAGEIVFINKETNVFTSEVYFQWLPNMSIALEKRKLNVEAKLQDEIFLKTINRMIKSCPEVNNWIIPLSGGYDSRVIVNYLYKLGIKNVICYSYGVADNEQSQLSQQIAEALGYHWYFIDYEEWTNKLQKTSLLEDYIDYAFNGTSTAHLQDFPAVYALKQLNILQKGDVFVPGHTLDFITGGHLIESMEKIKSKNEAFPFLERHFSNLNYYSYNKTLRDHIAGIVKNIQIGNNQIPEYFNWKERQSKFIINSVRCYEFFGFEWRTPLWDKELTDYWIKIEFNFRMKRGVFIEVFKDFLVVDKLKNIPLYNDLVKYRKPSLKERMKSVIPTSMKTKLRRLGFKTSSYYKINEGLNLVYSDKDETIHDFVINHKFPCQMKSFIMRNYRNQEMRYFGINTITSILLLRKYYNKNNH
ncbi:MAG TPA: asparagine synthase C-terminal domain-containing protein [Edaphocola sp.]|nr:asparagine synthase C-terminal domain-containing protein [Edaphocola sp.]